MKRKITWIRHGESEWNASGRWQGHTDIPLSDSGRRQAGKLSQVLDCDSFDALYSSDLSRALETARLACPGREITVEPLLREINFGIYEGKSHTGLSEEERRGVDEWWASPYATKLPGGESMECLNRRISSWMDTLPEVCSVAVFTHGGVVRNAIWQVVGPPHLGAWSVTVQNTSQTVIEYTARRTLLHSVNDVGHLR